MELLTELLSSKARAGILTLFMTNPEGRFYVREITRLTNTDIKSATIELDRLQRMGLVIGEVSGNRRYFKTNTAASLYPELKRLVIKTTGLGDTVRSALKNLPGIEFAFVYGSVAAMSERPESDLDLFIVGSVSGPELHKVLSKAKSALAREINTSRFTLKEVRERFQKGDSFIKDVVKGKKVFIVGTEREFKSAIGAGPSKAA